MSEQFYTILTDIGQAKVANATALGEKLNLVKFQVGDGNGNYYNPSSNQEHLKNKVWEGPISSIEIDPKNPNWIIIQVVIPSTVGGFMIREAGVFDENDNLIAIGKYPETYKPIASDGSTKDLFIKMILEVSNASNVTLKIDPSVIIATKKDVEILEQKIKDIKVPVTSVNSKTGAIELKAKDINCEDGKSVESHLEETVTKPTIAIGNNIAIFDANQDKLKDSGKSIGNTSGKILELPSGLMQGDLLRVGINGQIERLPKGADSQGLIIQDGAVKWGYTGCRIVQGRWKDTTTQVPFNSEYVKTIPLGFNAKRGRLYVVSKYGGADLNTDEVMTHFICFNTELFNLNYTNFSIKTIGYDGNHNKKVFLDSIQIINDNLVIKSKSEQGYGSTYNTLKVDIGWEVEG